MQCTPTFVRIRNSVHFCAWHVYMYTCIPNLKRGIPGQVPRRRFPLLPALSSPFDSFIPQQNGRLIMASFGTFCVIDLGEPIFYPAVVEQSLKGLSGKIDVNINR